MSEQSLFSADDRPRRVLGIPVRRQSDTLTLKLDDTALELSETASFIYLRLDGHRTVDDLAAAVADEYGVTVAEVREDVLELLDYLASLRVIES